MENKNEGSAEFDRCIDFLAKMIELYGAEVLEEIAEIDMYQHFGFMLT